MAQTFREYNAPATYSFTFPSYQSSDVKVRVDGVLKTAGTHYNISGYTTNGGGTVVFIDNSGSGGTNHVPSSGVVRIYRDTNVDAAKAEFTPGSSVKAADLNNNTTQLLYRAQEEQVPNLIQSYDIGAAAIETNNIKDDAVTMAKLGSGTLPTDITVASANLVNGTITNDDINTSAAIAGTKVTPAFGNQNLSTSGTAAIGALTVTGNIGVSGSVDGRDVSVDGSKLDGIEAGATTDQTNAEIKTAYEANSNTNAFTDAEQTKLSNIEDNAKDDQTAAEIRTLVESANDSNVFTDADHSKLNAIESGATADQTAAEIKTLYESNSNTNEFSDAEQSKLAGIETAATADQTASEIKTLLQSDKLTASEIATGALDGRYYTETESDARYFNISTGDTIKDGDTFPDNDTTIATTAAINDRIIDLVDDVGGFVPIANETSFPTSNPDVNGGAGTIVSVKAASTNLAPSGTTVTIANGRGSGLQVLITGVTATIPSGFGFLVETTTTDHTYAFHRLVPKATEVTTVAGKATEIGRLGTAAAVEDMSILGTTDVVADMAILGTADVVSDMNTLGTADVVSDMNTLGTADVVSDMNALATTSNITAMDTCRDNITSINNASSNINSIANFGDQYQVAANNPSTDGGGNALAAGDLYFNTSANELKVYTGSAWQGGVTATGNFATVTGNTFTGDNKYNDGVNALFGTGSDLKIYHNGSHSFIQDTGTGGLFVLGSRVEIGNPAGNESGLVYTENGAVDLYYDNSKKFETTSTGISVTGLGTIDNTSSTSDTGLTISNSSASGFTSSENLLGTTNKKLTPLFLRNTGNAAGTETYLAFQSGASFMAQWNIGIRKTGSMAGDLLFHTRTGSQTSAQRLKISHGGNLVIPTDNAKLQLGASQDLEIYHSGTHSFIENNTGHLLIRTDNELKLQNGAGTENMAKFIADGAVELYYDGSKKAETTTDGFQVSNGNLDIFNTSGGANIRNVSSSGSFFIGNPNNGDVALYVQDSTDNNIILQVNTGEKMLECTAGGSTDLYHHGSKKLETTSTGCTITGGLTCGGATFSGAVNIPDNYLFSLGSSNDLQLFHNGSNSYISNRGAGSLVLESTTGEAGIILTQNGSIELRHDNSKKFETLSTGAKVSGTNFRIEDAGDVTLTLNADTDNSDETHSPTIDFTMDGSVNVMKIGVEGNGGDTFTGSSSNRPYIITTTGHTGQPLDFGTNNVKRMELTNTALVPASNDTYDLGTNSNKWRDIYVTNFKTTSTGFEASGTEFKFSDTADTNVIINADTDNHDEAHHPSLSFKQDGAVHVLDIGVNGSGPDYTGGTHNFAYVKVGGHANVGLDIATSGSAGNAPTKRLTIDHNGHIKPGADSTYNIGTNTNRFANIYADTLYGDGSNLTGISSDLVDDTSPQLGGTLDTNGNMIRFPDATGVNVNRLKFGTDNDLHIYHNGTDSTIRHEGTGKLVLQTTTGNIELRDNAEDMIVAKGDGAVELYYNHSKKLETTSTGATVTCSSGAVIQMGGTSGSIFRNDGNGAGFHFSGDQVLPANGSGAVANNAVDLGAASYRWKNIYTQDLQLSNEAAGDNGIDGTWGNYTIVEGESDLFLKNNRSGKTYKFNLTEVS